MTQHATTQMPLSGSTMRLRIRPDQLNLFYPVLQRGIAVPAAVGCSLKALLCDQFGIPAEYVAGRITTIFLDNRPVDDLEGTVVREGSRVTLSAAMPGLVGAVMRRSGFYATLRQGITHAESAASAEPAPVEGRGTVVLKLFNLLLAELGPLVLARGVLLKRKELEALLADLPANLLPGMDGADVGNGNEEVPLLLSVSVEDLQARSEM